MSAAAFPEPDQAAAAATGADYLFQYEIRRDGRLVATLRAYRTPTGVTVDSEVFSVAKPAGEPGVTRPFTFDSIEQARRFTDEALVAFEYLNCSVQ